MIKLSKAGKMPCRSWSLQALTTCPGSKDTNGELVDACKGCYATTGNYRFPNVKAPREHNQEDWQRDSWVDDMVAELDNDRYFRWFDSGDMYHVKLAHKILEVMQRTPWVKHWLPTREAGILKEFKETGGCIPSNLVIRLSATMVNGAPGKSHQHSSTVHTPGVAPIGEACSASKQGGQCLDCRACWNPAIKNISYEKH